MFHIEQEEPPFFSVEGWITLDCLFSFASDFLNKENHSKFFNLLTMWKASKKLKCDWFINSDEFLPTFFLLFVWREREGIRGRYEDKMIENRFDFKNFLINRLKCFYDFLIHNILVNPKPKYRCHNLLSWHDIQVTVEQYRNVKLHSMNNACMITSCKWNHLEKRVCKSIKWRFIRIGRRKENEIFLQIFFHLKIFDKNLSVTSKTF